MKYERSGITLLLMVLLVFSMALGFVYSAKGAEGDLSSLADTTQPDSEHHDVDQSAAVAFVVPAVPAAPTPRTGSSAKEKKNRTGGLAAVSPEQALNIIKPFIDAASMPRVVEVMRDIPVTVAHSLLQKMIHTKLVSPEQVSQIIAGLAGHYSDPHAQAMLFDILLTQKDFLKDAPILYYVAQSPFVSSIRPLLAWAQNVSRTHKKHAIVFDTFLEQACLYAIKENSVKAMKALFAQGVVLSPTMATRLLWDTVASNKKVKIAKMLIAQKAQVNYAHNGTTLLMKAVENHNFGLVKALLAGHADPNFIADPAVGSVLQLLEQLESKHGRSNPKLIKIEEFLRLHGASH